MVLALPCALSLAIKACTLAIDPVIPHSFPFPANRPSRVMSALFENTGSGNYFELLPDLGFSNEGDILGEPVVSHATVNPVAVR